jgi:hypothetical protein
MVADARAEMCAIKLIAPVAGGKEDWQAVSSVYCQCDEHGAGYTIGLTCLERATSTVADCKATLW